MVTNTSPDTLYFLCLAYGCFFAVIFIYTQRLRREQLSLVQQIAELREFLAERHTASPE